MHILIISEVISGLFLVRLFSIQFIGCPYKNWWFCIKFRSAVVSMRCWEQRRAGRPNLVHTQILSDQGTKPCKSGLVLQCLVQISNAVVDSNNTVLRHSSYKHWFLSFFPPSSLLGWDQSRNNLSESCEQQQILSIESAQTRLGYLQQILSTRLFFTSC